MRVQFLVVPDDGTDGYFWRNGEHWLRQRGEEFRILDLAPELESMAMMEMKIGKGSQWDFDAQQASMEAPRIVSGDSPQKQEAPLYEVVDSFVDGIGGHCEIVKPAATPQPEAPREEKK